MYTTECKLKKEFSKFGPLEYVTLIMDGRTGQSRRFAFIYFESQEDAKAAKEAMSDQTAMGHIQPCREWVEICSSFRARCLFQHGC